MKKQAVYFVSLGCPKNRVDTEVMLGLTDRAGYTITTTPEEADHIVVNTCGFIGEAKEESVDTILEMARFKTEGACKNLVVTGCLTQRYAGDLARDMPEVDHFLGSGDVDKIVGAIKGKVARDGVSLDPAYLYDDVTPRLLSMPAYTAYVKIAEGCDRPCSFCIIPKLRGGQRSRDAASIEREVRDLVGRGAFEINLVAQDLTTYGKDLDGELQLASLVRRLAKIDGLRWLRLHYAYPTATTDALLDAVAEEPRVAKYIDMPLQHIDDDVLKKMRRGHVGKTTRALVKKIRERIPGVTLRTTFIVGHPGETDDAFARLADFVKEAEFDRVGVFTYSNEDGTHAAKLADELGLVSGKDMEKRRREIMRIQRKISRTKMKQQIGRDLEVLVEGPSEESEYLLVGRHEGQAPEIDGSVFLALGDDVKPPRTGDLVRARVTGYADYDLAATVTGTVAPTRMKRASTRLPVLSA
ncbi:MAG TPA: 30S ribosomal protein S12 methylthiotransferase RimO [Polyangia bacterium]|jgi:ribosomal protein S12 methylthiotransferase|nr:30S ribosomal protein S12 methylthiotransferase RimO [Polyangia bacterium]